MEAVRARWTDDRMDDLKHQLDELGRRTDAGFVAVREEMDRRFDLVEKRFDGMEKRFDGTEKRFDGMERRFDGMERRFDAMEVRSDSMNARFDATQRAILVLAASMFTAMLGLIATQL